MQTSPLIESLKQELFSLFNIQLGDLIDRSQCEVYRAQSASEGAQPSLALKVLEIDEDNEDVQKQMKNEEAILTQVQHDNIIQLLCKAIFKTSRHCAILMEMASMSCQQLLEKYQGEQSRSASQAFKQRRAIVAQVAAALHYLHSLKIAHNDVNIDNVLIFDEKEEEIVAKLADFGLARYSADLNSAE